MAKLNFKLPTPEPTTTTPVDVAKSYTANNWPVFPCREGAEETVDPATGEITMLNEKTPRTSNGFHGASKTERILDRWWADHPASAIGIPTGEKTGVFVLDIDAKPGGANGFEWLEAMEAEHGQLPPTARVITPNNGLHIYFNFVSGVRNRGGLGAAVDLRGEGGYVLAAGSVMADGRAYRWTPESTTIPDIADAPEWLLELLLPKAHTAAAPYHPHAIGNTAYVNRAIELELAELAEAPQGTRNNRLNDAAFALGQFVGAGVIAHGEAERELQAIAQPWGNFPKSCGTIRNGLTAGEKQPRHIPEPEWVDDNTNLININRMIARGLEKAKALEEAAKEEPEPEQATSTEPAVPKEHESASPTAPQASAAFHATPFTWKDPRTLPRREFAFGTHYIRKYVSVTVSPGGLGKTSNSIVEALAMVSGKPLAGTKPKERLNVWLFNAEDPRDEMDRRIMAACVHYDLQPSDIEGRLYLDTGREQELIVMHEDKKSGLKINEPVVEAVVEQIKRLKIDVMIVDPFVSTHRVNENDNGAIDKVAKLWAQIADVTNCAIDVVHHLRKLADREATVEDARGAVSLIGAARSVRVLNRMSEEQATRAGLEKEERFSYFFIHHGKVNLTKMDNTEHWRKLESVSLGNGAKSPLQLADKPHDTAGVVTEWRWPSKDEIAAQVPHDVRKLVLVRLESQNCRESDQSDDWAGYVLAEAMGIHVEAGKKMTADKRKVKAVLESWIAAGILVIDTEDDPQKFGRKIKYVRPAPTS